MAQIVVGKRGANNLLSTQLRPEHQLCQLGGERDLLRVLLRLPNYPVGHRCHPPIPVTCRHDAIMQIVVARPGADQLVLAARVVRDDLAIQMNAVEHHRQIAPHRVEQLRPAERLRHRQQRPVRDRIVDCVAQLRILPVGVAVDPLCQPGLDPPQVERLTKEFVTAGQRRRCHPAVVRCVDATRRNCPRRPPQKLLQPWQQATRRSRPVTLQ